LNITPSRARRQLAARLALHKHNAENNENGNKQEEVEHQKNLNPFATEEDDDSDNDDNDGDFSIGDLDGEDDGRGLLGPSGQDSEQGNGSKHVGIPSNHHLASILSSTTTITGLGRAAFPSMWPFNTNTNTSPKSSNFAVVSDDSHNSAAYNSYPSSFNNRSHGRGENSANDGDVQSDDSDDSDEGRAFGGDAEGEYKGKRRLSATTEAKRRTSLEDDDEDEEVVHVAMAEADVEAGMGIEKGAVREGDDEELVEVHHAETQEVETK
jgi:hypothetical protein